MTQVIYMMSLLGLRQITFQLRSWINQGRQSRGIFGINNGTIGHNERA